MKRPFVSIHRMPQLTAIRVYVLDELGRHGEALESYNEAIRLNPRYALAHLNKGKRLATWAPWGGTDNL